MKINLNNFSEITSKTDAELLEFKKDQLEDMKVSMIKLRLDSYKKIFETNQNMIAQGRLFETTIDPNQIMINNFIDRLDFLLRFK